MRDNLGFILTTTTAHETIRKKVRTSAFLATFWKNCGCEIPVFHPILKNVWGSKIGSTQKTKKLLQFYGCAITSASIWLQLHTARETHTTVVDNFERLTLENRMNCDHKLLDLDDILLGANFSFFSEPIFLSEARLWAHGGGAESPQRGPAHRTPEALHPAHKARLGKRRAGVCVALQLRPHRGHFNRGFVWHFNWAPTCPWIALRILPVVFEAWSRDDNLWPRF